MGLPSAHVRSLRDTVESILKLQIRNKFTTYEAIAEKADLSSRHIATCIAALTSLGVITPSRDLRWSGPGYIYAYHVNLDVARACGYLSEDFDLLVTALRGEVNNAA